MTNEKRFGQAKQVDALVAFFVLKNVFCIIKAIRKIKDFDNKNIYKKSKICQRS